MTETVLDPPSPPPPPPPRLVRDPDDRVVAGVCAAAARHTGTDPVLWRVATVVLALLGGAGLALYVLGWLLVPRADADGSIAERVLRRPDRSLRVVGVLAAVVVAIVLLGLLDDGAAGALLVLAGVGYLVTRERRGQPLPAGFVPTSSPEPEPAATPRERSPLGAITVSLAVLLLGLLLAARAGGYDQVTTPRLLAVLLLVLGGGVLIGGWWGRARWLIPIGVVVALLLAATSAVDRSAFDGGVGERRWQAVDGGSYRLAAGSAVLDLRDLRGRDDAEVEARVGIGEIVVLVPQGMSVLLDAEISLGELHVPGVEVREGERIEEQVVVGSAGDVTVTVDLMVGVGQVEVRRVAS